MFHNIYFICLYENLQICIFAFYKLHANSVLSDLKRNRKLKLEITSQIYIDRQFNNTNESLKRTSCEKCHLNQNLNLDFSHSVRVLLILVISSFYSL